MQRFFTDVEYVKRNILAIRARVGEINQQASFDRYSIDKA